MDDENGTGLTIKDLKILFTDSGQDVLTRVIPSSHFHYFISGILWINDIVSHTLQQSFDLSPANSDLACISLVLSSLNS